MRERTAAIARWIFCSSCAGSVDFADGVSAVNSMASMTAALPSPKRGRESFRVRSGGKSEAGLHARRPERTRKLSRPRFGEIGERHVQGCKIVFYKSAQFGACCLFVHAIYAHRTFVVQANVGGNDGEHALRIGH